MSDLDNGANTVQNTSTRGLMPPWPKGVSGNPSGRPKRKPITEAYERILQDPKVADAIARAMVRQAKKGNVRATIELADRVEGKLRAEEPESVQAGIKVLIIPAEMRPPSEIAPKEAERRLLARREEKC